MALVFIHTVVSVRKIGHAQTPFIDVPLFIQPVFTHTGSPRKKQDVPPHNPIIICFLKPPVGRPFRIECEKIHNPQNSLMQRVKVLQITMHQGGPYGGLQRGSVQTKRMCVA